MGRKEREGEEKRGRRGEEEKGEKREIRRRGELEGKKVGLGRRYNKKRRRREVQR